MEKYLALYEHTRATGQVTKPTTRCLKTQVSVAKKANAQPDNHKTVKQNNHKVITVGQSPATWDRTHPRNLLQMTVKGKPECHSPTFEHTQTTPC